MTLTSGKEKWCAGCHDNAPSVVNGNSAPDICGDNATYGYYLGTHGDVTYGVNQQGIGNAQGECVHCHEVDRTTDPAASIISESFEEIAGGENDGYDETWTEILGNGSTLDADSAVLGSPPPGSGSQCLQSVSNSPGYRAQARLNYVSEQPKTFTTLHIYVDVETEQGLPEGAVKTIIALRDNANNNVVLFRLEKNQGQLRLNPRVYNNGVYQDYYADISSNTWHKIEIRYSTIEDFWEWRLDGVNKDNGNLTGTHYEGVQNWNLGFMVASQTVPGTIYFDQMDVKTTDDWVGDTPHGGWLFASPLTNQETGFCFGCHTDSNDSLQTDMPPQYSYGHKRGNDTNLTCPDNIKQAFAFIDTSASMQPNCGESMGSAHYLSDVRNNMKGRWGWSHATEEIDPCMGCHNPHRASRDWPCSKASGHENVKTWEVWGDGSDEKMADYAADLGGVYQSPFKAPYPTGNPPYPEGSFEWTSADEAPNYNAICGECHSDSVHSTRWDGELVTHTGQPRDLLGVSAWFEYVEDPTYANYHGVKTGLSGGQGTLLPPYEENDDKNYILMCTDCHEPHGSENYMLLRTCVNGRTDLKVPARSYQGGLDSEWRDWCEACHHLDSSHYSLCAQPMCHVHKGGTEGGL
jgi:hypothetical protein